MAEWIEVEYTGRVKEDNTVFDTTDKALAQAEGFYNPQTPYGPVVVCLGEGHLVNGLEDGLQGKDMNKDLTIELEPEQAFGKKQAQLLKVVPAGMFKKQNINPQPGLQVNIDGNIGIIRTTGGRVIVDFNHPLASKDIVYQAKILRKVDDPIEEAKALFRLELHLTDIVITLESGKAVITTKHALPEQITTHMTERIIKLTSITSVEYQEQKTDTKKA